MDEALYVESAVFMLRGVGSPPFVSDPGLLAHLFGRAWPLMIVPYVGATKAFVTLPLFVAFGIRAESARFAGVLLGCLGIAGLVALIGTEIHPAAGLIAGVLLAIHPSYLDFTVFDNGGASVWMGAMGLGAWTLHNYLRRRSTLSALLLGIAIGLGVWARANVVWLVVSVMAAALLVCGRRAIPDGRHIVFILIGVAGGAAPLIAYEARSRFATLDFIAATRRPLSAHEIGQRLRSLSELMIADGEQRGIWWGPPRPIWQVAIGALLLGIVLVSLGTRFRSGDPSVSRWRRGFAWSAVILTGLIVSSNLNVGQHHLVAVLPLALGALAILSVELARCSRAAIPLLAAGAIGLVAISLASNVQIGRGVDRTGGKWVWSSAINDVKDYLQSRRVPPDRLKILNWGFQNNLYVISEGSVHGRELFWNATESVSARGLTWSSEIADGGWFLFFPVDAWGPSPATRGFLDALKVYRGPRARKVFTDRMGTKFAVVIEVPPTH